MAPVQKDRIATSPPRPVVQGNGMITRSAPAAGRPSAQSAEEHVPWFTTADDRPANQRTGQNPRRPVEGGRLRESRLRSVSRRRDQDERRSWGGENEARGRGECRPLVDGRRGRRRDTGGRRARRCGRRRHARRRGPLFLLVAALAEERQLEVLVLAGGVVRGELEVEPVVLAALGLEVNRPDLVRVGRALNCIAPAVADPRAHLIRQTGQREALAVRWTVSAV